MRSYPFPAVFLTVALALAAATAPAAWSDNVPPEWQPVVQAIGTQGQMQEGGVLSVSLPRPDLNVTSHGVALKPGLSFSGEALFYKSGSHGILDAEFAVLFDEIQPTLQRLHDNGLSVSALHRHLLDMSQEIMWIHTEAVGDPLTLARALHNALTATGIPLHPTPDEPFQPTWDTHKMDQLIGSQGMAMDGVWVYEVDRKETPSLRGITVPPSMGFYAELRFQPLGPGKAASNGEIACRPNEVDFVIRELQAGGLEIEAEHNHFLDDDPRFFYVHYWAAGDALGIAKTVGDALEFTDAFPFLVPGYPQSQMALHQGHPPVLFYHLHGANGYEVSGKTTVPSLQGAGTIQSVETTDTQVIVTATNGRYVSSDGVVYTKSG